MRAWVHILAIASVGVASFGFAGAAEPVVAYTITNGSEITGKLTGNIGAPGDATRGRVLYEGEARAGCAVCHGMPGEVNDTASAPNLTGPNLPGPNLTGPNLTGIGGRLSIGALRLWIVAPSVFEPETAMPGFYAAGQRDGATDPLYGGPALSAVEIEDLVAYLVSEDGPD